MQNVKSSVNICENLWIKLLFAKACNVYGSEDCKEIEFFKVNFSMMQRFNPEGMIGL